MNATPEPSTRPARWCWSGCSAWSSWDDRNSSRRCSRKDSVDDRFVAEQTSTEPLEQAPTGRGGSERLGGNGRGSIGDGDTVRRLDVYLGDPFGHHEPSDRLFHRAADGERTMVAQDAELLVAERRSDALAPVVGEHLD